MSRSYKEPISKDGGRKKKLEKQFASKAVRRYKGDLSNGGCYKKLYEAWNICDYEACCYASKEHRYWLTCDWSDWEYIGTWYDEEYHEVEYFSGKKEVSYRMEKIMVERDHYIKRRLGFYHIDDWAEDLEMERKARRK